VLTLDANIWVAALDARDHFHAPSVEFLRAVGMAGMQLHGPESVTVEVACAVARRARVASAAVRAGELLRANPLLLLHPLDTDLLDLARELGVGMLLRAGDALYVATAKMFDAELVSWDAEVASRGGAVTPEEWMTRTRMGS